MPRTVQEILDHADELAERFDSYEPTPDDERDPQAFTALRDAAAAGSAAERSARAVRWMPLSRPEDPDQIGLTPRPPPGPGGSTRVAPDFR